MSHSTISYEDVEPLAPGMHFLREPLDCENLGLTVIEGTAGWEGLEHDHEDDRQEEVYVLLEGAGSLAIDGDTVDLNPGVAVRVAPDATRQLTFSEDSVLVVAGAA